MQYELCQLHLRLLNYALTRGHSYVRWQQVINSMLWKEHGNHKIHRTRVIHLFEADYNLALSLKWREALFQAERTGLLYKGQYGSRPRKSAYDPVLLEVLQTEVSRITRKSMVMMNFDATSCYDRILPSLANLASRKFGVPPTVAQMNVTTLENTSYRLRTGLGVSSTGYSHCDDYPIYGIGQGAGNASQTWNFLSSVLLQCHEDQVEGAKYESPDKTEHVSLPMVGFVDDNNGQCNQFHSDKPVPIEDLVAQARHEITTWNSLLRASGGALELSKCTYQIMAWGFTVAGAPILKGGKFGPEIYVPDDDHPGRQLLIPQLSAHSAHKTLGHYISPAGTNKKQLEVLKERSDGVASTLMASGLSRSETWTYYFSTYLPSVGYSLPMQHFGQKELNQVQSKALNCIIARCGFNRHTHRAIIFGSTRYGGANFRHLYTMQGAGQLQVFLRFWRLPSTQAGQLLRISVAWLQVATGVSFSVFQDVSTSITYSDSLWLMSIREYLNTIGGQMELSPNYVPRMARENDSFIMDLILASNWFNARELKALNWCRLYLQAVFISDVSNVHGTHIDMNMYKGIVGHDKSSITLMHQFVQDRPSNRSWSLWRKATLLWSTEHGKLRTSLGPWCHHQTGSHRRVWPCHYGGGILYTRLHLDHKKYQVWTLTEGSTTHRVAGNIINATEIPTDAYPVEARRQFPVGFRVLAMTTSQQAPATVESHYNDATEYFLSFETWESELLGATKIAVDAQSVIDTLQSSCVLACDGSVNSYEAGSFGWTLSNLNGQRCATNNGPVRGSRITSYRAEGHGILSATRFLARIHDFTHTNTTPMTVKIVCDNISMVRNVKKFLRLLEDQDSLEVPGGDQHFTLQPLQPEWDVLNEVWHTIKDWSGLTIAHVKGHQDTITPAESLSLEATLNVEADALAGQYLRQHPTPLHRCHLFPHTHVHLHLDGHTITYRHALRIRNADSDANMIRYLKEKYQWNDATFERINWNVHGKAIRSQRHRKTHITKLVHDILPTNRVQHRWNPQHSNKCALCQREEETRDHLMQCDSAAVWRSKCLRTIGMKCEGLRTHKGLESVLIRGLLAIFQGHNTLTVGEGYSQELTTLIYSQNAIGWSQLFNGRWSTQWSIIQGSFMGDDVTQHRSPMGDRWNVALIQDLWALWYELWDSRNAAVHGVDEGSRRASQMEMLKRRMRNVYAQQNRVEPSVAPVFNIPMEERLARGLVYVQNWLAIHESLVHNSVTRATARAIRGMRSLRLYFPGHIDDPG